MASSSSKQTVGYKHYASMLLSFCLGRIDAVRKIYYDDEEAWSGNVTDNTSIYINQPDLLGGDESSGGIQGTVRLYFGDEDQTADPTLSSKYPLVPAYRNRFTAYCHNLYLGTSQYIKLLSFEAERFVNSVDGGEIWYSEKSQVTTYGMNPAHIIYECLTSKCFGAQLDPSFIDEDSFVEAADTLYDEEFGLAFLFDKKRTETESFISTVLEYINGMLFLNYTTGKYQIKLIREDYDPDLLDYYDDSDFVSATDFSRLNLGELPNEVIINYTDPEDEWTEAYLNCQNLASIQAKGAKVSVTKDFYGIHNATLAGQVGGRELLTYNSALFSVTLSATRSMYGLLPGDVFKLSLPEYGIESAIVRVINMKSGGTTANEMEIQVAEDVFSATQTIYANPDATQWTDPIPFPIDFSSIRVLEIPYFLLVSFFTEDLTEQWDDDRGYFLTGVQQTNNASGYDIYQDVAGDDTYDTYTEDITASFKLGEDIDASITDASITITDASLEDTVSEGDIASLGNELIKIKTITATTVTFARGVLDTLPEAHSTGDVCIVLSTYAGYSLVQYSEGDSFNVKLLPWNARGKLEIAYATATPISMNKRMIRPYVPANFTYTGTTSIIFSWKNRNRLTQTAYVVEQDEASIALETNQSHTLTIFDGAVQKRQQTGLTGTDWEYTQKEQAEDFGVEITGIVSPDVTGEFTVNGTYNGEPKWEDGTYAIWYDGSSTMYITVIAEVGTTPTDNAFELTGSSPIGTYTPIGTATGNPVVSVGDMSEAVYKLKSTRDGHDSWAEWSIS